MSWTHETFADFWKRDYYKIFFNNEPTEEDLKASVTNAEKFLDQIEKRLSSGVEFLGGSKISTGDIRVFACFHSFAYNEGSKHASIREGVAAAIASRAHIQQWVDRMNGIFADYLAARPKPRVL